VRRTWLDHEAQLQPIEQKPRIGDMPIDDLSIHEVPLIAGQYAGAHARARLDQPSIATGERLHRRFDYHRMID